MVFNQVQWLLEGALPQEGLAVINGLPGVGLAQPNGILLVQMDGTPAQIAAQGTHAGWNLDRTPCAAVDPRNDPSSGAARLPRGHSLRLSSVGWPGTAL